MAQIKAIFHTSQPRNQAFAGRDELLSDIHAALHPPAQADEVPQSLPVVLEGLGGIGKTQVALEYCYRYRQNYDVILWIRADLIASLIGDLEKAARLLGICEAGSSMTTSPVAVAARLFEEASRFYTLKLASIKS
jgi:hypothetical protein